MWKCLCYFTWLLLITLLSLSPWGIKSMVHNYCPIFCLMVINTDVLKMIHSKDKISRDMGHTLCHTSSLGQTGFGDGLPSHNLDSLLVEHTTCFYYQKRNTRQMAVFSKMDHFLVIEMASLLPKHWKSL